MSQREICAYTLLPRQTVNNVINVFASQGLLRLGGAAGTTNASSASISPTRGSATANRWSPPCARRNCRPWQPSSPVSAAR
ncbi:MarR family transcriptional regulator [Bifidobacterium pseudolongum]|uniref:MarR family transcriptional regulator n=1 Tax=Bifidobacterium pseudolongum TaxID=1694 RepID=UPI0021F586B5|nr:helix-turn-helix domain-containing protein [Bifidobacterium pseudolongum]